MKSFSPQPWLHSAPVDSALILAPAFITSLIAVVLQDDFAALADMPVWTWVVLVLCIDVAHVYATLFRTYFHPAKRIEHHALLVTAPLLVWMTGTLLYVIDALLFWRVLAYLAVFHFIRQQYGFVRLYSRHSEQASFLGISASRLDQLMVYGAALCPVIWWHANLPRDFHWFIDHDFFTGLPKQAGQLAMVVYAVIVILLFAREWQAWRKQAAVNLPRMLVIAGTACSWWVGIVLFDNDLAFTLTNVVSHGVPYMALVWIYNQRDRQALGTARPDIWQRLGWSPTAFLLVLGVLAYFEEGLWDGLVWREHSSVFGLFSTLPAAHQHAVLAVIVPLLTVPQATHYVLDGFIWKRARQVSG